MAGAALHHLTQGNLAGARGLLRDAARHVEREAVDLGLDTGAFARELASLADAIDAGAVRGPGDLGAAAPIPRLRHK